MKIIYLSFLALFLTVSCSEEQYNLETEPTSTEINWVQVTTLNWPNSIPLEKVELSLSFKEKISTNLGTIQLTTGYSGDQLLPKITWITRTNCIVKINQLQPQQTYFLQLLNFVNIDNTPLLNQNLQFMTIRQEETQTPLSVTQTYPTNNSTNINTLQRKLTIQFNNKITATNFILRISDSLGQIAFTNITSTKPSLLQTIKLKRDITPGSFLFGIITIVNSTNNPYRFNFKTSIDPTPKKDKDIYSLKISEIMTGKTGNSDYEFIELYNPSPFAINLTEDDLRIYRASESGATSLVCSLNTSTHFMNDSLPNYITIPPFGYYLLVNSNADVNLLNIADAAIKDRRFCLTDNNTIFITTGGTPTKPENIIDMVGYGTANIYETTTITNIEINKSIERKANKNSTLTTMRYDGYDNLKGNSYDSQNNGEDFINRDIPEPQNSRTDPEIIIR